MQKEATKARTQGEKWAITKLARDSFDFYNGFVCRKVKEMHDRNGWGPVGPLCTIVGTDVQRIRKWEKIIGKWAGLLDVKADACIDTSTSKHTYTPSSAICLSQCLNSPPPVSVRPARTEPCPPLSGKVRLDDSYLPKPQAILPGKDSEAFFSCLL